MVDLLFPDHRDCQSHLLLLRRPQEALLAAVTKPGDPVKLRAVQRRRTGQRDGSRDRGVLQNNAADHVQVKAGSCPARPGW